MKKIKSERLDLITHFTSYVHQLSTTLNSTHIAQPKFYFLLKYHPLFGIITGGSSASKILFGSQQLFPHPVRKSQRLKTVRCGQKDVSEKNLRRGCRDIIYCDRFSQIIRRPLDILPFYLSPLFAQKKHSTFLRHFRSSCHRKEVNSNHVVQCPLQVLFFFSCRLTNLIEY